MSRKLVNCSVCGGAGVLKIETANTLPGQLPCLSCKGTGQVMVDTSPPEPSVCRRCGGSGRLFDSISDGGLSSVFGNLCPCIDPLAPSHPFW